MPLYPHSCPKCLIGAIQYRVETTLDDSRHALHCVNCGWSVEARTNRIADGPIDPAPDPSDGDAPRAAPASYDPRDTRRTRAQRRQVVKTAALRLVNKGQREITPVDVWDAIPQDREFDIPRPTTAINGVLRNMAEFKRVKKNHYRYVPSEADASRN